MDRLTDIGEVASRSGMAASTLRYYEQQGIITSRGRHGLRRQFSSEVFDVLAVVAMCQRAGFSLAEIKKLLATGGDVAWKDLAARKRDDLRVQIGHLTTMADQLDHALECPSPNVFLCSHFQAALHQALPVTKVSEKAVAR